MLQYHEISKAHRKKKKNGRNDIMTEGRTRCMIVRVERGLVSHIYIPFILLQRKAFKRTHTWRLIWSLGKNKPPLLRTIKTRSAKYSLLNNLESFNQKSINFQLGLNDFSVFKRSVKIVRKNEFEMLSLWKTYPHHPFPLLSSRFLVEMRTKYKTNCINVETYNVGWINERRDEWNTFLLLWIYFLFFLFDWWPLVEIEPEKH